MTYKRHFMSASLVVIIEESYEVGQRSTLFLNNIFSKTNWMVINCLQMQI